MSRQLAVGDILELRCGDHFAYASYTGKHEWLGDCVWVVDGLFSVAQQNWADLFQAEGYFIFFAAHSALRQKVGRKVGFAPEAMRPLPALVRTRGNRDDSGRITSWVVTDGTIRFPRLDDELSPEERRLPIGVLWNLQTLCERLREGKRPDAAIP